MSQSCALQVLSLLRNIPEAPLLAIAKNTNYTKVLLDTNGPLPDAVFSYLYDAYPGVLPRRLLYARPLSYDQRAIVFANPGHPSLVRKYMELFFKYNVLTHQELQDLDPQIVIGSGGVTIVTDLLRRHRHDPAALGLILGHLPEKHQVSVFDARVMPNPVVAIKPSRLGRPITPADLARCQDGLSDGVGETADTVYDPIQIHVPVKLLRELDNAQRARYYLEYKTAMPYDGAPVVALLGENPSRWLAFLAMLDAAGEGATLYQVAQTVLRARTSYVSAETLLI